MALALVLGCLPLRAEAFDFDKVKPGVVFLYIELEAGSDATSQCTGFVIAPQTVATNNHCVALDPTDPGSPLVHLIGAVVGEELVKENFHPAEVVWRSTWYDLAVLSIPTLDNPPLPLAVTDPKQGTDVWAVGFPGVADILIGTDIGKLSPKVTEGTVSFVGEGADSPDPRSVRKLIQHDAAINPGNSGGPLVNGCNEVVAVNTFGPNKRLFLEEFGDVPEGINFGSHISVLTNTLKNELPTVSFSAVTAPCVPQLAGIDVDLPPEAIAGIIAAVAVALAALAWSFYSHARLRYAIRDMGHSASRVVRSVSRSMVVDRGGSGTAAPRRDDRPAAPPRGGGWSVSGRDSSGESVTLRFTDDEVRDAGDEGLVVGRQRSLSDLIVADGSVSRRHATFRMAGSDVAVVDLNSKFGTVVDGQKLKPYGAPARLRDGAELRIGDVRFTVRRG